MGLSDLLTPAGKACKSLPGTCLQWLCLHHDVAITPVSRLHVQGNMAESIQLACLLSICRSCYLRIPLLLMPAAAAPAFYALEGLPGPAFQAHSWHCTHTLWLSPNCQPCCMLPLLLLMGK